MTSRVLSRRTWPLVLGLATGTAFLASGCASTVPAGLAASTIALLDVSWAEGRFDASAGVSGEEAATSKLAMALLDELGRKGFRRVSDARSHGVRPADLGTAPERAARLLAADPADAYLSVRLLACGAWPSSSQEFGRVVHWYAGECTAEATALDGAGRTLAKVQQTGRWDGPRRERLEGRLAKAEAITHAVDAAAERLARELSPGAPRR